MCGDMAWVYANINPDYLAHHVQNFKIMNKKWFQCQIMLELIPIQILVNVLSNIEIYNHATNIIEHDSIIHTFVFKWQ